MAPPGLVWYGGRRLMLGTISVGNVVAFILLVRELCDLAPEVADRPGAKPVTDVQGG